MRKALTIGELLVTMTIIGVIAALVLPGFLKDYHKRIYTTKLKKTYEILDNAINQACTDNNVSYFYQTPYATYKTGGANQQEFLNKYFKTANRQNSNPFSSKYKILASGKESSINLANSGWAKLASGEAVSFFCDYTKTRCVIRVDVNSTDGPNIGGRDLFAIAIDIKTNKLGDVYNAKGDKYSPDTCGTEIYGYGCLEKILENNWEMDY